MKDFKEQLKKVTEEPGVYLMKDAMDVVIYVGKAKNLRKRLSSYFRGFDQHEPKTQTLVVNIDHFEYIITHSEVEALILEATLIKQYRPRFNIRLKDDKDYPYIKVTLQEAYPRVLKARKVVKDGAKYFGPYTSNFDVNQTLEAIHKIFPIRQCSLDLSKTGRRPCLNYHIKKCLGPCMGTDVKPAYMDAIQNVIAYLSGGDEEWIDILEKQMKVHAEALRFEQAAEIRDQIHSLRALSLKQNVVSDKDVHQDIIGFASKGEHICFMVLNVRHGRLVGREQYILDRFGREAQELLSEFMVQYYAEAELLPKEIVIGCELEDAEALALWLSGLKNHRVHVIFAQKGDKKKVLDMAVKNAWDYIEKYGEDALLQSKQRLETLAKLQSLLSLGIMPLRLEAYDISNLMGVYAVGSMVVYEEGLPKKSDYRRFKVRTIEGPNDVGSMQEILYRRFRRYQEKPQDIQKEGGFFKMPDLLLIDGGKGQVNAVEAVLMALNIQVPVAGMVKNQYHRTEALYYQGQMYTLPKNGDLYAMIYRIQEEVHRFAITYHKSLREKGLTQSLLDGIQGIGTKRKMALLKTFKTVEAIQNASAEELAQAPGMNRRAAEQIKLYFQKGETSEETSDR